jgi:tetratricopeptide (TPR) repeat protein
MKTLFIAALAAVLAHDDSPAERKIAAAKAWIERSPESYQAENALALALARRARETSDPKYYEDAEEALKASFRLSPDNFEGARLRAWILLGKHDFKGALEAASALNRRAPDDLVTYALLVDAHVELGNYTEAEKAGQWLLDLRPGNVAGLTRGAYLREIFGDVEGALEWMLLALEQTHFNEVEDRAWLEVQMAHLELSRGRLEAAEGHAVRALELFADYHYALFELAKVRMGQGRHDEAVSLLRLRYEKAPHPENLYELASAVAAAGGREEADSLFAKFEADALREAEGPDNANRELVFYYTDHASRPDTALAVAEKETARRGDVFTRDAHAWALHKSGRSQRAREQIESALETGIRDARMLYHAGAICAGLGDRDAALRYGKDSLAVNPHSPVAAKARELVEALEGDGGP